MSNYILCIQRDVISDPPKDSRLVIVLRASGQRISAHHVRHEDWRDCDVWRHEDGELCIVSPGDQWLDVTNIDAISLEGSFSIRDYEYQRGREFFAKQILSEIDSGKTAQEIAKTCLGEIRRCHRAEIDKEREREGLPPVDWSTVP